MGSETGHNAGRIGIELPQALDAQFKLLERLVRILAVAKEAGELDRWAAKVRKDVLIDQIGCSNDVADNYIAAALERI